MRVVVIVYKESDIGAVVCRKSCTIIINGKQRCIRDGSWYDCPDGHSVDDFVRIIQEEAGRISHRGEKCP
jgi:hypothetical protein